MSDNHLTILVVEPGKPPYPRQIPDTLQAMQEIVGGDIDATYPYEDPVALIFNSSGKFAGLQPNRLLRLENGDPYDVVCGTLKKTINYQKKSRCLFHGCRDFSARLFFTLFCACFLLVLVCFFVHTFFVFAAFTLASFCQSGGAAPSNPLPLISGCMMALDNASFVEAGEAAKDNDLYGAVLYGIGNSTEAVYYLDAGWAQCLVAPDEFDAGYESVAELIKKRRNFFYKMKDRQITYTVLTRENLFSEENRNLLFTISR